MSVYGGSFATRTQPPRVPGRERLALLEADSAVEGGRRALELPRVGGGEEGGRSALELNGVEDGDRRSELELMEGGRELLPVHRFTACGVSQV